MPVLAGTTVPGIAPFIPLIQTALAATQTFVVDGTKILASTTLSAIQKAEEILKLGNPLLAQLNIPGVPATIKALLSGVIASVQAVLSAVQASTGAATGAVAAHIIANPKALAPSHSDIAHFNKIAAAAENEQSKIAAAFTK